MRHHISPSSRNAVMENKEVKMSKELFDLISKSETELVINILKKHLNDDQKLITLISARYHKLKKENILGVVDSNASTIQLNKINYDLMEMIDDLEYDAELYAKMEDDIEVGNRQISYSNKAINIFDNEKDTKFKIKFDSVLNEQKNNSQGRYNIVVVGKTGVGKSSLINYLFNNIETAKTGVGKPVTSKGFHKIDFNINGVPATLFDSCGVEVGNSDLWLNDLISELKFRDVDKPASHWFHTVLYCIAASSARVEEFEINVIKQFIKCKYNVVIVFTKSDLVDLSDMNQLKITLKNEINRKLSFCEVCSIEKELKTGKTKQSGSNELHSIIDKGFWESISLRLPERCINIFKTFIKLWRSNQYCIIDKMTTNSNPDIVHRLIEANSQNFIYSLESEKFLNILINEVRSTIKMYDNFSKKLDYQQLNEFGNFQFHIRKLSWFCYARSKEKNLFRSILLLGVPIILNEPRNQYVKGMKKVVDDFCDELMRNTSFLRPEIEKALNKMLKLKT